MSTKKKVTAKKRVLSPAARKRIADAQHRRWSQMAIDLPAGVRPNPAKMAYASHPTPAQPSTNQAQGQAQETTVGLRENAVLLATSLRRRVVTLGANIVGGPSAEQGSAPTDSGFNSRLVETIAELNETHEIVCKLGSYLGIEV